MNAERVMIRGGLAAWAAAQLLIAGCGEEVPRTPPEQADRSFNGHACDLVSASDLSQIFVQRLEADRAEPPGDSTCTWNDAGSGRPVVSYRIRPYMENIRSGARQAAAEDGGGEVEIEVRQGLGEAAVWTDVGLFVSRSGRTLQVTPFDEEQPRPLYEELASLLLERMESP